METINYLINDGQWVSYLFVYGFIGVLVLRLLVYLFRVNFTDYDPWK